MNIKIVNIVCIKYLAQVIILSTILLNNMSFAYVNINIFGTGLYLPYSMGVLGYIKKNIPIKNYNITGISGGAWCALLYTQEKDLSNHDDLWDFSIGKNVNKISFHNDIRTFQSNIEKNLKLRYSGRDIIDNNNKISIIASNVKAIYNIKNVKKNDFTDINDLIDYCLCSSYIPYISGNTFSKKYKDKYYVDGEIKNSKTLEIIGSDDIVSSSSIDIDRFIWGRMYSQKALMFLDKENSKKLFNEGWEDSDKNREILLSKVKNECEK
jgi:hypothetical protein